MTDKKTEALKLALEYLRDNQHYIADNERHAYVMEYNAFVERLEALAEQPAQQEPVAWMFTDKEGTEFFEQHEDWEGRWTPLYTSPPASKPLTDEQIAVIAAACGGLASNFVISVARAIEAAHGIKGVA